MRKEDDMNRERLGMTLFHHKKQQNLQSVLLTHLSKNLKEQNNEKN